MASRRAKATDQEKEQIRELLKAGEKVEEVCARFPHINGQVISGMAARIRQFGIPESSGETTAIPKPARPESSDAPTAPVPARPPDRPEQVIADNLGFTKTSDTIVTPGGLRPAYREYFVIKKLSNPNAGIIAKEFPPFTVSEFLERYEAGEYEIEHYREGKLYLTYRETISSRAKELQKGATPDERNRIVRQETPRSDSPVDAFFRALDFSKRLHDQRDQDNASVRAAEVAAKTEEVKARAQLETVQTSGLLEILKEERSKPAPKDSSVSELLTVMREEREAARERHKQEMESAEKKHTRDLEIERERRKAEADAAKLEADNKIAREREYLTKLKELDDARQILWKESYDNMMDQAKGLKDSISEELDKRREADLRMSQMMLDHTKEVIDLKKAAGSSEKDIEMAKIISNGISGGLDRIGSRVDMLVNAGVIGEGGNGKGVPRKVASPLGEGKSGDKGNTPAADAANSPKTTEAVKAVTKEMIKEQIKEPWFQDLQREIALTVKKRMTATTPAGKPHGSMLGQTFLDRMNEDLRIRTHFHFLCTRQWEDLLVEIEEGLTEENKKLFREKEAALWFDEFQSFLILAWNNTIGVK